MSSERKEKEEKTLWGIAHIFSSYNDIIITSINFNCSTV